jgi:hypothetical protein
MSSLMSRRAWVGVSLAAAAGAVCLVPLALLWHWVACESESDLDCAPEADLMVAAAIAGVVPVTLMVVASVRARGRPARWLALALAVYVAFAVFAEQSVG